MDEATSERLDTIEAWVAEARAKVDGLKAEMDAGGESPDLGERMRTLKSELEAEMRALDELSGGRLRRAHGRRTGARWSRRA